MPPKRTPYGPYPLEAAAENLYLAIILPEHEDGRLVLGSAYEQAEALTRRLAELLKERNDVQPLRITIYMTDISILNYLNKLLADRGVANAPLLPVEVAALPLGVKLLAELLAVRKKKQ